MDHLKFHFEGGGRPDSRRAGFQGLTGIEQGGGRVRLRLLQEPGLICSKKLFSQIPFSSPLCAVSLPPREQLNIRAVCTTVCSRVPHRDESWRSFGGWLPPTGGPALASWRHPSSRRGTLRLQGYKARCRDWQRT